MLRRGRFKRVETILALIFAGVLFAGGVVGAVLAAGQQHWRLAIASLGVIAIAVLYLVAALRRRPL